MAGKKLVDYHIHTRRCGHATGDPAAFVAAARARGLREIGFADHIPQYFLPVAERDPGLAMAAEELDAYVTEVLALGRENRDLPVRLGIEADYVPGKEEALAAILQSYPFDYVLGSIHYLDGWGFDNPAAIAGYAGKDIDLLYRDYCRLLQRMVATGLFDVVAHPDLLKKFGYRPRGDVAALYEETVRAIAAAGVVVEVNTAGLRQPVGEIYPAPFFLSLCYRYDVPVTLGSDAHRPEDVGRDLNHAVDLLLRIGYREVVTFEGRRRRPLSLL